MSADLKIAGDAFNLKPRPPPLWNANKPTCVSCLADLKFFGSSFESTKAILARDTDAIISLFICPECLLIFQCFAHQDRRYL